MGDNTVLRFRVKLQQLKCVQTSWTRSAAILQATSRCEVATVYSVYPLVKNDISWWKNMSYIVDLPIKNDGVPVCWGLNYQRLQNSSGERNLIRPKEALGSTWHIHQWQWISFRFPVHGLWACLWIFDQYKGKMNYCWRNTNSGLWNCSVEQCSKPIFLFHWILVGW